MCCGDRTLHTAGGREMSEGEEVSVLHQHSVGRGGEGRGEVRVVGGWW